MNELDADDLMAEVLPANSKQVELKSVVMDVDDNRMLSEMNILRNDFRKLQEELASVRSELSCLQSEHRELLANSRLKRPAYASDSMGAEGEAAGDQPPPDGSGENFCQPPGQGSPVAAPTVMHEEDHHECWSSEESIWDVILYFDMPLSLPLRCFLGLLYIINAAVQVLLVQVISEMIASKDPLLEDREGLLLWRLSVGHHVAHFDDFTGSNLVSRVCKEYVGLTKSYSHVRSFNAYKAYLANEVDSSNIPDIGLLEWLDTSIGQFLCSIVLLVWTIHICMEIHDTYKMALAYTAIPRARHTKWQTSEDGTLSFISLSWRRYITLVCFVIVPRSLIAFVLLSVGSRFVIETSSLADLILNALALSFVLELDELFFKLVPTRCRDLINQSAPIPVGLPFYQHVHARITESTGGRFRSHGLAKMFAAAVMLGVWLYYYLSSVSDFADDIKEAYKILCEGNTSFIYTTNRATGTVYYSDGRDSDSLEARSLMTIGGPDGKSKLDLTMSAVLQLTGLRAYRLATVDNLQPEVTGDRNTPMALITNLTTVGEMQRENFYEALARLPCDDLDQTVPDRYALYTSVVLQAPGLRETASAPNTTHCGMVTSLCTEERVRRHCPVTCSCRDVYHGHFDLRGCPPSCESLVEDELRIAVQRFQISSEGCGDAMRVLEADSSVEWWRTYFWQLQDYLAKEGYLTRIPGATAWPFTGKLREEVQRRTQDLFSLAEGAVVDLVAIADKASRSDGSADSPCVAEVLVRIVFDLELCVASFDGNLRGTLVALCPIQCNQCSPLPKQKGVNNTLPLGMSARSWSWREIVQFQQTIFGVSLVEMRPPPTPALECGESVLAHGVIDYGFLPGPDVVFALDVVDPMRYHTIHLCTPNTEIDTVLRILEGPWQQGMDAQPSLLVREVDDSCGPEGLASSVTLYGLQPGTYTVWIDGPSADGGQVEVMHRCTTTPLLWETVSGTCEVVLDAASNQSCLQSPNFPGDFLEGVNCEIRVFPDAWQLGQHVLSAEVFQLTSEAELHVNAGSPSLVTSSGQLFKGQGVQPRENIIWMPDRHVSRRRRTLKWKVCAEHFDKQLWRLGDDDDNVCQRGFYIGRDCITNNGFGDRPGYRRDEHCFVHVHGNWSTTPGASLGIHVHRFETEETFDYLAIDKGLGAERQYSGSGADLAGEMPIANVVWTSDYRNEMAGWTICVNP